MKKKEDPLKKPHPKNRLDPKTKLSTVFLVICSTIYFSPKNNAAYMNIFLIKTSAIFLKKKST